MEECSNIKALLCWNMNIFVWSYSDMPRIDPSMAAQKLNILSNMRPMRQKVQSFHSDRQRIIWTKVDKLLAVSFIREVAYLDWLANVVIVPKNGGTWRVYMDYTNLNDTFLKDNFLLPWINHIVDSTFGNEMFSFLNAFFGYHQIPMFCPDKEKTTFITSQGLYCYNIMLLGLKNAGATYQRLITKIFKPLMGWTMEVYIDDIIAKSKTCTKHMQHLEKAFALMRKCNKKLNPLKCAFGVRAGKFLGFLVTQWGIKINQDQVKVLLETPVPSTKKEIQRLTGRLAALGRFIARFTNKLCSAHSSLLYTKPKSLVGQTIAIVHLMLLSIAS